MKCAKTRNSARPCYAYHDNAIKFGWNVFRFAFFLFPPSTLQKTHTISQLVVIQLLLACTFARWKGEAVTAAARTRKGRQRDRKPTPPIGRMTIKTYWRPIKGRPNNPLSLPKYIWCLQGVSQGNGSRFLRILFVGRLHSAIMHLAYRSWRVVCQTLHRNSFRVESTRNVRFCLTCYCKYLSIVLTYCLCISHNQPDFQLQVATFKFSSDDYSMS